MKRASSIALSGSGAVLILLFLNLFELPGKTFFWRELNNSGHAPLFGLLALSLLWLSRLLFVGRLSEFSHYLLALTGAVFFGAVNEFVQIFGHRDADLYDLLLDLLGILSFLLARASFDRHLGIPGLRRSRAVRPVLRVVAVVLMAAAFVSPALWGIADILRDRRFPRLVSFESYWENKFVKARRADLRIVEPPAGWRQADGRKVAKLTVYMRGYSGLEFIEPYPDWSTYRELSFYAYSEERDTLWFAIRIHDVLHNSEYTDRFTHRLRIVPGANSFVIPLDSVRKAPASREMDMSRIASFMVFTANPPRRVSVCFDDVSLR